MESDNEEEQRPVSRSGSIVVEKEKRKRGLEWKPVDTNHWASGIKKNNVKYSRLSLRILEAKNLLASDLETGKSDPLCFVWCGDKDDSSIPKKLDNLQDDKSMNISVLEELVEEGILRTDVCYETTDPIWFKGKSLKKAAAAVNSDSENEKLPGTEDEDDTDMTFQLAMTQLQHIDGLGSLRCYIKVMDEDKNPDGTIGFDQLGCLNVPFIDIIRKGRILNNAITLSAAWYELKQTSSMKIKVDGKVKLTISIVLSKDDVKSLAALLFPGRDPPPKDIEVMRVIQNRYTQKQNIKSNIGPLRSTGNIRPSTASPNRIRATTPIEGSVSESTDWDNISLSSFGTSNASTGSKISKRVKGSITGKSKYVQRPKTAPADNLSFISEGNDDDGSEKSLMLIINEGDDDEKCIIPERNKIKKLVNMGEKDNKNNEEDDEVPTSGDQGAIATALSVVQGIVNTDLVAEMVMSMTDMAKDNVYDYLLATKEDKIKASQNGTNNIQKIVKGNSKKSIELMNKLLAVDTRIQKSSSNGSIDLKGLSSTGKESVLSESVSNDEKDKNNQTNGIRVEHDDDDDEIVGPGDQNEPVVKPSKDGNQIVEQKQQDQKVDINIERNLQQELQDQKPKEKLTQDQQQNKLILKNEVESLDEDVIPSIEKNAVQGSSTAVIRALKEMANQRQLLGDALSEMTRMHGESMEKLNSKIDKLRKAYQLALKETKENNTSNSSSSSKTKLPSNRSKSASRYGDLGTNTSAGNVKSKTFNKTAPAAKISSNRTRANINALRKQAREDGMSSDTYAPFVAASDVFVYKDASGKIKHHSTRSADAQQQQGLSSSLEKLEEKILLENNVIADYNGVEEINDRMQEYMRGIERNYNQDFASALQCENIEQFGRLIEEASPRPDLLSLSIRNQVYDMIATLLYQNAHIERCLMWILELVKNKGSNNFLIDMVGHTKRDIYEALERASREPSKRGLLASLLKSQWKSFL